MGAGIAPQLALALWGGRSWSEALGTAAESKGWWGAVIWHGPGIESGGKRTVSSVEKLPGDVGDNWARCCVLELPSDPSVTLPCGSHTALGLAAGQRDVWDIYPGIYLFSSRTIEAFQGCAPRVAKFCGCKTNL